MGWNVRTAEMGSPSPQSSNPSFCRYHLVCTAMSLYPLHLLRTKSFFGIVKTALCQRSMQNDGVKTNDYRLAHCLPGSAIHSRLWLGFLHTSYLIQGSYHSGNPFWPAARQMEGTQSLPDPPYACVSTRQCKDAAGSHSRVVNTAVWESHLPQGTFLSVCGCPAPTQPSAFALVF